MGVKMSLRKKLLPTLVLGLGTSLLIGCEETKIEYSKILHEEAVVSDVVYTPSRHGSGSGIGPTMGFDGNIGIAITHVDVNIPEKYAVIFKCQHGKFIIQGTSQRYKNLWEKLERDQNVIVEYREVYKSVYDDIDGDGVKDLIKRELIKYDFLDANLDFNKLRPKDLENLLPKKK